nr:hypothetical protein Itr_chr15CG10070 [Ipomoea trifida]
MAVRRSDSLRRCDVEAPQLCLLLPWATNNSRLMGSNGVSFLPCLPGELVAAVEMAGSSGSLLLPVRREQHEAVVRSAVIVLSGKALPAVNGGRRWTVDGGAVLVRAKCF